MTKEETVTEFTRRRRMFDDLCTRLNIPIPLVAPSRPGDTCDYTDHAQVRLNIEAAGDTPADWHVAHVFGHYLCCLHGWGDSREDGDPTSDLVANTIASLVTCAPHGSVGRMHPCSDREETVFKFGSYIQDEIHCFVNDLGEEALLEVQGGGGFLILPQAANHIQLRLVRLRGEPT